MKTKSELAAEAVLRLDKKYSGIADILYSESVPDLARAENRLPTGVLAFDYVIGGGLIRGSGAVETFGAENVGKSTLAHFACKHTQQVLKEPCLWVQTPGEPYDRRLAEMIGCDFANKYPPIYVVKAKSAEHIIDVTQDSVATNTFSLVVIDSIAALRPSDEYEKKMTESPRVAGQPSMVQRFISKITTALYSAADTALLMINQQRATHEQRWTPRGLVQAPPHTPGGHWLRHMVFGEVYITTGGQIAERQGDRNIVYGRTINLLGRKGKMTSEHGREASVDFYVRDCPERQLRAGAIDWVQSLYDIGKIVGVVTTKGAYASFLGERVQGRTQFEIFMREHLDVAAELDTEIRRAILARQSCSEEREME